MRRKAPDFSHGDIRRLFSFHIINMVLAKKFCRQSHRVRFLGHLFCYTGLINQYRKVLSMERLSNLFDSIRGLCRKDVDRIIAFVMKIPEAAAPAEARPSRPYCGNEAVIKYGRTQTAGSGFFAGAAAELICIPQILPQYIPIRAELSG